MKSLVVVLGVLVAALPSPGQSGQALAAVDVVAGVDIGHFHDRLGVYGDWIHLDPYGSVWMPRNVAHDWRPYLMGRWVVTDCGWTWVSDEPWGWATDHYGRWFSDASYGWVWVPGTLWGPAWVAWRQGDGYVGWAPLPPGVDVTRADVNVDLDPFAFCFVEQRFFLEPVLVGHVLPPGRNVTVLRVTKDFTHYTFAGNRIVNRGVDVREIERASRHAVTRFQLRDVNTIEASRGRVSSPSTDLAVHGPMVPSPRPIHPAAAAPTGSPAAALRRVDTWTGMQGRQAEEQSQMRAAQAFERQRLQSLHEQDQTRPPTHVSRDELLRQQGAENQAQAQHERIEQHVMDARHDRERQAFQGRVGPRGR